MNMIGKKRLILTLHGALAMAQRRSTIIFIIRSRALQNMIHFGAIRSERVIFSRERALELVED